MGNRLSKIVTKTGDDGTTGLADGSRRNKNDIRVHCLGEVDELNALIGLCSCLIERQDIQTILLQIQHDLFDLGAELSQPSKNLLSIEHIKMLDQQTEQINQHLPPLSEFILPGGSLSLSNLHLARTVCRRVERNLVTLNDSEKVNTNSLTYLNRLSDLLFILTRYLAAESNIKEVYWQSGLSRIKSTME